MTLARINEFQAAAGKAEAAFNFLKSLQAYITASPGCAGCEVWQSNDQPEKIMVIEQWDSPASHQASLDNYPKDKLQAVMGLFGAAPKGAFYHR